MSISSRFDKLAFWALQLIFFLSPIFFVPSISVPFQTGKTAFFLYGIVVIFVLWLVARLKDGVFNFPKNLWYASTLVLAVVYTVAAFVSANTEFSIVGQFFDLGSLGFFLPSLLLFLLVPLVVKSQKDIFISYGSLLASFFVVGIFHIVRFVFGADVLSFGFFPAAASNVIGKWNDVGVFFGLISIISFITIDKARFTGFVRILAWIAFVVSLAMLVVVNFSLIWIILGVLSLLVLVYELSFGRKEKTPFCTLAVLIISAFFIFGGSRVGNFVSDSLGVSQIEVRPSWGATLDVSKSSIKANPAFGVGPNRFSSEWVLNKPAGINNTLFWNTDFSYGIGFLSSFAVTTGLVGLLAIILFLALYVWTGVKALLYNSSSQFSRYLTLTSLFASSYLFVVSITYVPSVTVWIMTVIMAGLFVSAIRDSGAIKSVSYSVLEKPSANFASVLLIIFVIIGSLSFGYFLGVRTLAGVYFQKAVNSITNSSDIDSAEAYANKAYALVPKDIYARYIADIYIARLNILFTQKNVSQAEAQQKFQSYIAAASKAAQAAIALDNTNYANYTSLGTVYETVVPLDITGAYDGAKQAYEAALALNPSNPQIYLLLARLEIARKNNDAAEGYIADALQKKGDYADAVYLLAQMRLDQGKPSQAIQSIEALSSVSPNDPVVFFQLGRLYYDQDRYDDAVFAFGRAIELNPQYADAKYYLGLSLYMAGDKSESLQTFKKLQEANPDNQELKKIVNNLESGKSPMGN